MCRGALTKAPVAAGGSVAKCVEAFGRGLKVDTAVQQEVWAHSDTAYVSIREHK